MFNHIMVGSNDIARSKHFYDALFRAIGGRSAIKTGTGRLLYLHKGGAFMVTEPIDGAPATRANGGTIGFSMDDAEQAQAWHAAGLAHGGVSIEEPPGVRTGEFGSMYLAYLRDPDGHKLCAVYRMPADAA